MTQTPDVTGDPSKNLSENSFLRLVIDSLNHPFYVIDTRTHEILLTNKAAAGQRYECGMRCHELTHRQPEPCTGESDPCPIDIICRTGKSTTIEHVHFSDRGEPRHVEVHAHPIRDEAGEVTRMIEYSIDVTERELAERSQVRALEAAEQASRAKGEFLANMGHEIRTPMNAVLGMTHLLLDTQLDPEQREHAETVRNSAESLLTILNSILDFSCIDTGRLELDVRPFQLRECVEAALSEVTREASEGQLKLSAKFAPGLPEVLLGDDNRVRQVLVHLLGNAVKFTEQGQVSISVSGQHGEDDRINIEYRVQDTGIGIPADRLGSLFQEFTQMDASITRRHGGTGLGLAVSKGLSELMGGSLRLESELGQGTTAIFRINTRIGSTSSVTARAARKQAGELEPVADRDPSSLRILIAEDNPVNQRLAGFLLERMGVQFEQALSGVEVLELFRQKRFDVVLMDLHMPEMDGLEATRLLRSSLPPEHQPHIVALTAAVQERDRQACLDAGMDAFLAKPIQPEELAEVLRQTHGAKLTT